MDYREQEQEMERRNAEFWREEKEAKFAVGCPECGSVDGMVDLYPDDIVEFNEFDELGNVPLYRVAEADFELRFPDVYPNELKIDLGEVHALFAACPTCNPGRIVDESYAPVAPEKALAWARCWQKCGKPPQKEFWKGETK